MKEILDLYRSLCLYSSSVISGWIRLIFSDAVCCERKIAENHPDPPRNYTQWISTHKEQDKSSISTFIFKFSTDWGACGLGNLKRVYGSNSLKMKTFNFKTIGIIVLILRPYNKKILIVLVIAGLLLVIDLLPTRCVAQLVEHRISITDARWSFRSFSELSLQLL